MHIPRRFPIRPPSEPIERDDDAIVDVAAPRETKFVSGLVEADRVWTAERAPTLPMDHSRPIDTTASDARIRAMTDAEFEAYLRDEEGLPIDHFHAQPWKDIRK